MRTSSQPPFGTLIVLVDGSQPQSAVTVEEGVLGGRGSVGPVHLAGTFFGAAYLQAGSLTAPGALDIQGDLQISFGGGGVVAADGLFVRLNGPSPGVDYDQILVNGNVSFSPTVLATIPA